MKNAMSGNFDNKDVMEIGDVKIIIRPYEMVIEDFKAALVRLESSAVKSPEADSKIKKYQDRLKLLKDY